MVALCVCPPSSVGRSGSPCPSTLPDTAEKTGSILLDLRRGQANPLLAALKAYQQAVEEGNLLLVTYECVAWVVQPIHRQAPPFIVLPTPTQTPTHPETHQHTNRTVTDYLLILREAARALAPFRQNACLFLAAAVSDFFVPPQEMQEHKIQSSSANKEKGDKKDAAAATFELLLKHVPKCLPLLRREWAPHAFVVSFKLETDPDMLMRKALGAIDK